MSSRGKGVCKETQNDLIPTSSAKPVRSDDIFLVNELSRTSDAIKWAEGSGNAGLGKDCPARIDSRLLVRFDGRLVVQPISIVQGARRKTPRLVTRDAQAPRLEG